MTRPVFTAGRKRLAEILSGQADDWTPQTPGELQDWLEVAREEGVINPLVDRWCKQVDQEWLKQELSAVLHAAVGLSMAYRVEATRVLEAISSRGLRVLVLKGAALSHWLYPQPHLRYCGDLDVLFASRDEAGEAVTLLQDLGYSEGSEQGSESYELSRRRAAGDRFGVELDIHWRLINAPVYANRLPFDCLWDESIPLPALGEEARCLLPRHALLHSAMNRVVNLYAAADDNLKCLYDIHLLAAQTLQEDWPQVMELAASAGLCGTMLSGLGESRRLFGTAIPGFVLTDLAQQQETESLDADRLDRWLYMQKASLMALPWRMRCKWVWQRLLPPDSYLQSMYGKNLGVGQLLLARGRALLRRVVAALRMSG